MIGLLPDGGLDLLPEGAELALFKFALNAILLLLTWTVGRWLLARWEHRRRIRELDLEARKRFHELLGGFKSHVRLWKAAGKPDASGDCPELFKSVVEAEGQLESLLTDLPALRRMVDTDATEVGLFRQGYQTIREAMSGKKDREVPSEYNTTEYRLFNAVAMTVSRLLAQAGNEPTAAEARSNLKRIMDVRSAEWKGALELAAQYDKGWEQLMGDEEWSKLVGAVPDKGRVVEAQTP